MAKSRRLSRNRILPALVLITLLAPVSEAALVKAEAIPEWISPDNPAFSEPVSPGAHDFATIHFVLDQPHNVSMRVFTPEGAFFRVLLFRAPYPAGDGYVQWDGLNDERTIQADVGTWPVGIYLEDEEGQNLAALVHVYVDRVAPRLSLEWQKSAEDTPRLTVIANLTEEPPIPPVLNATFNGEPMSWASLRTQAFSWTYSQVMPEKNGRVILNVTSADLAGNNDTEQLRFLVLVRRPSTPDQPALIEVIFVPEGEDWPPFPSERRSHAGWFIAAALVAAGASAAAYFAWRRRQ